MGPLVLLSIALVVGIVAAPFCDGLRFDLILAGAILATAAQLLIGLCCRGRPLVRAAAGVVAAAAVGMATGAPPRWGEPVTKSGEHVVVGEALRRARGGDGRMFAVLRLRGAATVGKEGVPLGLQPTKNMELRLSLDDETARQLRTGDALLFRVRGLAQRRRRNFGDTQIPAGSRGAFGVLVAGPVLVAEATWWRRIIHTTREALRRGLQETLSPPSRALACALVLGDRTDLAPEEVDAFRRTGAAHLLAVSGLHVAMVGFLCQWLVMLLLMRTPLAPRLRVAAPAAVVAIAVCWGYALLTGLAPPAFRAAVMITAALLAQAVGRPAYSGRAIWLAAAVLLLGDPAMVGRPGFQLSFAAVFALSGLGGKRPSTDDEESGRGHRLLRRLLSPIARATMTALAATLATAPLVAHHFGQVSPWGVAVNVVAVPVMGFFLLPGTLLLTFVGAISFPLGRLVALVMDRALLLFLDLLRWASELPGACINLPRPNLYEAVLLALAGMLVVRPARTARICGALLLVAGLAIWAVRLETPRLEGTLQVTFIDVGAGDATMIELPRGGRMLVDAGPRESRSTRTSDVVTALQRRGYGRLRLLALTHGHGDHAAGIPGVIEQIGAVRYWPPLAPEGPPLFVELARSRGATIGAPARPCRPFELGGVRFEVLHPCHEAAREMSENDRSLVLRLRYGNTTILLPGDIEGPAEELILQHHRGRLRSTVLKLAHHGSDTSTSDAFLEAVAPSLAVASCGSSRRRQLPHPVVVRRLRARGVPVLSTARQGALRLITDGRTLRILSARSDGELPLGRPLLTGRASGNM